MNRVNLKRSGIAYNNKINTVQKKKNFELKLEGIDTLYQVIILKI